jgi:hypothetical protein
MTSCRTVEIDDTDMFYREAGDPAAPTLLLVAIAAVGVVFTVRAVPGGGRP